MTTSQLGRTKLVVWPDLGEAVDWVPGLQASITELSTNAPGRFKQFTSENDSTTVELEHNLGLNLNELTVLIYTGSGTSLTRVQSPTKQSPSWGIAEKTGSEKTHIEVTTPSSGQPHTFAVVVLHRNAKATVDQIAVSTNITLADKSLHLIDTSAARSLTLPPVDANLYLELKDVTGSASTFNVTLNTPGAETIDGGATFLLDSDYMSAAIVSDGTNYFVI